MFAPVGPQFERRLVQRHQLDEPSVRWTVPSGSRWRRDRSSPIILADLSITGAQIHAADEKGIRRRSRVVIDLDGNEIEAVVRSIRPADEHTVYGIEFVELDAETREFLVEVSKAWQAAS